MSRRLTLCADDFGLSHPVNAGITELVAQGRLNAVSAMSVGRVLLEGAADLQTAMQRSDTKVELGLHLTFSEYEPLGDLPSFAHGGVFSSPYSLLVKSHLGFLNNQEVMDEIDRQWQRFVLVFERQPDFVDGHQHAHLMPTIRTQLIEYLKEIGFEGKWVRSCATDRAFLTNPKSLVMASLTKRLKKLLQSNDLMTNGHFFGFNDFNPDVEFGDLMRRWLHAASKRSEWSLIMCHPGTYVDAAPMGEDNIAHRRPDEMEYLSSDQFASDLKSAGFSL